MNYKLMLRTLGRTLQLEALCLLLPLVVCLIYREDPKPFLYTIGLVGLLGSLLVRLRARPDFFSREGFAVVGLIWVFLSLFGALPFWFSGEFASFADCFFEIVSGFTSSGASILTEVESLPRGILFWRSFSSWIGGMGVLIFTLAFLPKVGGRTQVLVQAEATGPVSNKLVPKTALSARILYLIYISLTLLEILALCLAGMPFYDAVVNTFATVCTGGFSVRNLSIASYGLPACEVIITVFMLLCSLNFAVFFLVLTGRLRQALGSDELRFFLLAVALSSAIVFFNVLPLYESAGHALRDTLFQVSSVVSTTGFSTADFALWPTTSQVVLTALMFTGACAGSTSGGIKISRITLLAKSLHREMNRLIHPNHISVIKSEGRPVDERVISSASVFFVSFILVWLAGTLVVSWDNLGFTESFTASLTCISNVGPGLGMLGPEENFSILSHVSKLVLSLLMLMGRLELMPILVLLRPSVWKER